MGEALITRRGGGASKVVVPTVTDQYHLNVPGLSVAKNAFIYISETTKNHRYESAGDRSSIIYIRVTEGVVSLVAYEGGTSLNCLANASSLTIDGDTIYVSTEQTVDFRADSGYCPYEAVLFD